MIRIRADSHRRHWSAWTLEPDDTLTTRARGMDRLEENVRISTSAARIQDMEKAKRWKYCPNNASHFYPDGSLKIDWIFLSTTKVAINLM